METIFYITSFWLFSTLAKFPSSVWRCCRGLLIESTRQLDHTYLVLFTFQLLLFQKFKKYSELLRYFCVMQLLLNVFVVCVHA
jgi:hypothetical protein